MKRKFEDKEPIYIVCGPTASGKSKFVLDLIQQNEFAQKKYKIINADASQIYAELPIITAQPEQLNESYRLYGFIKIIEEKKKNIEYRFSVAQWLNFVNTEIENAIIDNAVPILVGGTGLYINALLYGISDIPEISPSIEAEVNDLIKEKGLYHAYKLLSQYDEELCLKISQNDIQRIIRGLCVFMQTNRPLSEIQKSEFKKPKYQLNKFKIIYLKPERGGLYSNINRRFYDMIDYGVIDEIETFLDNAEASKIPFAKLPTVIGLREIKQYIQGLISKDEMIKNVQQQTRNYAKRQFTWFNKLSLNKNKSQDLNLITMDIY